MEPADVRSSFEVAEPGKKGKANSLRDPLLGGTETADKHGAPAFSPFSWIFFTIQAVLVVMFFVCTDYGQSAGGEDGAMATGAKAMDMYPYFQDVNVMIFIGFGYLMTFLKSNNYNSLGLTFLVSTLVIQWHLLVGGFMGQVFCTGDDCEFHKIELGLETMITALFAAGAVLITYGAVLGKVTPTQLCILGLLEIIFYSLNENIGGLLGITDVGGTMVVHMFGAYFGMAASIAIRSQHHDEHPKNASVYQSDMFAMIGTVFLWMFWPSFNGALATGAQQQRVVLNTFISLCGSCVVSFVTSTTFRKEKKFSMVDVQNATLAGGVAMGTSADLLIGPGAALLVGCTAGLVSTLGYIYVQPALESCIGFYDTCGVNNLHGMPAIIGATAGVIASTQATASRYGPVQLSLIFDKVAEGRTPAQQAINQLVFMCITLVLSLFSGGITGVLIKHVLPSPEEKDELFTDEPFWIMPDVEEPKEKGPARGSFRGSESKRLAQLESQIVALKTQLDGALKQQQ